ncbi:MAG: cyclic nucleotide-binding domain-containing protein [Elusimicrobia bacterium]|nr:cyclic nucleotide-binding domain-containing protein [Elusimicrobiota bacterium]
MDPFKISIDDETAGMLGKALRVEGFFPEFTALHAGKVFPHSALWFFPKDYRLIEQGDPGEEVFIIVSGAVIITKMFGDAGAELATLKSGELFGEIALVKKGVRTASVIVAEDSRIFRLVQEDMAYLLKENAALAQHLRTLAEARLSRG